MKSATPTGDGELLLDPAFDAWAGMARSTASATKSWGFLVAGVPASELRDLARREAVASARDLSARLGVGVAEVADAPDLIVATGHQPELYHPGVWAKDFLLQRLADDTGAAAVDLVVDSDAFESLGIHTPCREPDVRVCRTELAVATGRDGSYSTASVPSPSEVRAFRAGGEAQLATLGAPALSRIFSRFCACLERAAPDARNLAELVTSARRRYEAPAATDYLELPVTSLARSRAFATYVADIALDAERFAGAYNAALAAYRERSGTRTAAQPFPDLALRADAVELPLWTLSGGRRTVWVRTGDAPALFSGDDTLCELGTTPDDAADAVLASGVAFAPKALALTLFTRMFVSDLFIHGVGGGRYDQVTDEVARSYFGVEAPPFVVASLTLRLPLAIAPVRDEEIEEVSMALNRLTHNPDQMVEDVDLGSPEATARARALASEKTDLVARIGAAGADKKAIGARIRDVNAELASMLQPVKARLEGRLAELSRAAAEREILADRTYPFCLWDPVEVARRVR